MFTHNAYNSAIVKETERYSLPAALNITADEVAVAPTENNE